MATSLNVIRTLTVKAKTEGVDEAAASANKLADAQDNVTRSSQMQEKATLSTDAAFQKLQRRYDQELKAQQDLAKVQQTLDRARSQGLISQDRQNELMQLAIKAHNGSADAAKQHSSALDELQHKAQESASHLGSLGTVLAGMGPVALAVAAIIGTLVVGFKAAAEASLALAEKSGKLLDLSETVGLTVKEIQGLQSAGAGVGLSAEAVSAGLEKFSVSLGNIRAGTGSAVEALNRLSPGLVEQIQSAKTASEAFDLITKALSKMDSAEKSLVARDIFGKGGTGFGRLADATAAAGGIDKLADSLNKIDLLSKAQLENFEKLGKEVNSNFEKAGDNITATFAGPVLNALKAISEILLDVSRIVKLVGEPLVEAFGGPALQSLQDFKTELDGFIKQIETLGDSERLGAVLDQLIDPRIVQTVIDLAATFKDLAATILLAVQAADRFSALDFAGAAASASAAAAAFGALQTSAARLNNTLSGELPAAGSGVGLPSINVLAKQADELPPKLAKVATATKDAGKAALDYVDILRANVNALGDAATQSEKYELKVAELTKKYQEGTITADTYNRAIAAANPVMKQLKDAAGQLGSALVSAFINGKSAGEALNTTLKSISSSAASSAINSLLKGDLPAAAVKGLAGGKVADMFATSKPTEKAGDDRAQLSKAA